MSLESCDPTFNIAVVIDALDGYTCEREKDYKNHRTLPASAPVIGPSYGVPGHLLRPLALQVSNLNTLT
jgi:hypothetical protein